MDGNRRWAKKRGLPQHEGHSAGVKALERIENIFREKGIKVLTVYAFSTENWNRSAQEVKYLMALVKRTIKIKVKKFHKKNIRLLISGKLHQLSADLQKVIAEAVELTKNNTDGTINIALNYGGRDEIINAIKNLVKDKKVKIETLTEEIFSNYLYTHDLPDPDLMIRTGGQQRTSNFLPWQLAYSELYFCEKNWPDFDVADFEQAIEEYYSRKRNFGK
jgi:undecaprenyl diphosphate synthase